MFVWLESLVLTLRSYLRTPLRPYPIHRVGGWFCVSVGLPMINRIRVGGSAGSLLTKKKRKEKKRLVINKLHCNKIDSEKKTFEPSFLMALAKTMILVINPLCSNASVSFYWPHRVEA